MLTRLLKIGGAVAAFFSLAWLAISATPTKLDPKILFQGALSTTLTTTLYTASGRGADISAINVANTGAAARNVTFSYFKATTGRVFCPAVSIPAGATVNILKLCGMEAGLIIDSGDLVRGGQDSGTDVDCIILGLEMDT